jgi:DNA-binding NarL/FixJ family response regulator
MEDHRDARIHIVIWSHCRFAREALAAYLSAQPRFLVVGHAATATELRQLCELTRPQVTVVEVDQLTATTVAALADVRRTYPVDPVVLYTSIDPAVFDAAAQAGIGSFVPASAGLDAVARMVRYQATHHPATGGRNGDARNDGRALTDRELSIVSLMSAGHTGHDIAGLLRISPHTVDNHRRRLYAKLGVSSQSAAVARAIALGMVPWPWVASTTQPDRYAAGPTLTTREQEILNLIACGATTRQVARALGIATKTVENTLTRLYRKLGTHNRAETLALAHRLGLVDDKSAVRHRDQIAGADYRAAAPAPGDRTAPPPHH